MNERCIFYAKFRGMLPTSDYSIHIAEWNMANIVFFSVSQVAHIFSGQQ